MVGSLVDSGVAVALAAVPGRSCSLFGVAADAEFVRRGLVDAEGARWPFMAIFAGVESHMFRVVEVDVAVVGLEYLGVCSGKNQQRDKEYKYSLFHVRTPMVFLLNRVIRQQVIILQKKDAALTDDSQFQAGLFQQGGDFTTAFEFQKLCCQLCCGFMGSAEDRLLHLRDGR